MKHTKIKVFTCSCGYEMDATTGIDGKSLPNKGDVSLCFNCGKLYIFNDDLSQREPTKLELKEIEESNEFKEIKKARLGIMQIHANKN